MGSNLKVLIGDDSILARKQLGDFIKTVSPDTEIDEAADGEEAVKKYREFHPDITFLDIVMPKMDGISAVRQIMEYDEDADIVIVSSLGTQSQLKAAIEAGAEDFVQKPFSYDQIRRVIKNHLRED
jgi:two-component system, chemotaxis family, chemotaxis protein CheY